MIYTVTLSPTMDCYIHTEYISVGGINKTVEKGILPGGKGVNCSQMLTRMGVDNIATGFVGGVMAETLIRALDATGVKHDFITVDKNMVRLNIKVQHGDESGVGDATLETDFNQQYNKVFSHDEIRKITNYLASMIRSGDTVILAGSAPVGQPQIYGEIIAGIRSHPTCHNGKNVYFIVDTSGEALKYSLDAKPFLVKPNKEELAEVMFLLTGEPVSIETVEDVIACSKELQRAGALNVITTMGAEGAVLVGFRGRASFAHPVETDTPVVNTVGAGDSFVAGFAFWMDARTMELDKEVRCNLFVESSGGSDTWSAFAPMAFHVGAMWGSATARSMGLADAKTIGAMKVKVSQVD